MRAALGLPSVDELSASLYVDQQQRLEAQRRDLRYRHALYQDQLDSQLHELRLRANAVNATAAAEYDPLPELQQHYVGLLMQERLGRAEAEQAAAAQQQQAAALLSYRQAMAAHEQQYHSHHPITAAQAAAAAQLRYQEEIRQHQQAAALRAHLRGQGVGEALAGYQPPPATLSLSQAAIPAASPVAAATAGSDDSSDQKVPAEAAADEGEVGRNLSRSSSANSVELEEMGTKHHKPQGPSLLPLAAKERPTKTEGTRRKRKSSDAKLPSANAQGEQKQAPLKRKRGRPRKNSEAASGSKQYKRKDKSLDVEEERMKAEAILQAMAERAAGMSYEGAPEEVHYYLNAQGGHVVSPPLGYGVTEHERYNSSENEVARKSSNSQTLGTIGGLLSAADSNSKFFEGADMLAALKNEAVEWAESDPEREAVEAIATIRPAHKKMGLAVPNEPQESIVTPMMESHFPRLPEEPFDPSFVAFKTSLASASGFAALTSDDTVENSTPDKVTQHDDEEGGKKKSAGKKGRAGKPLNVLDYPYPVDTWWPSVSGRQKERHNSSETSDEDNFDVPDTPVGAKSPLFRANEPKIRKRLEKITEPGILEKLPHCRIHRLRKKNSTLAELVYCFQVTEIYPNEMMVCCSKCGTWRHACCGGHFEPYSVGKNVDAPFVAVCEQCHEEQKYINEYPLAKKRIDRQRMEQLRRGLATTSVMRSMSFSKHGGTYKWPLGSVSATHVGGHTRSVQARHDKSEKQWSDLLNRLGRGFGYRAKERQRVRTKELERLLVAVEDAEGQTDRHNMLLFLMRDTKKPLPAGFDDEKKNLFDPCYTENEFDSMGYTSLGRKSEKDINLNSDFTEEKKRAVCKKSGCNNTARFDSLFCSDGCGVHMLEVDLLRAFYESNDIHPSVLRSHY